MAASYRFGWSAVLGYVQATITPIAQERIELVEQGEPDISTIYDDLARRWRAGEIVLPTFGNEGFARNTFRHRALIVASRLIARGLSGAAAVDYLRRTEPRLLGFYEGKAGLALVDALSCEKEAGPNEVKPPESQDR